MRRLVQDGGDHFLGNEAHRLEVFRDMEMLLARHLAEPFGVTPVRPPCAD